MKTAVKRTHNKRALTSGQVLAEAAATAAATADFAAFNLRLQRRLNHRILLVRGPDEQEEERDRLATGVLAVTLVSCYVSFHFGCKTHAYNNARRSFAVLQTH